MPIYQCPLAFSVTTILGGAAAVSLKVPGTFGGFPPSNPSQARYFKRLEIVADAQTDGDYVDDIQLSDDDGVVPAPARASFPAYPQLINFSSDAGIFSGAKGGYYFDSAGKAVIAPIDDSLQLLPSGLYLKASIKSGGLTIGRVFRCTVIWGVYSA